MDIVIFILHTIFSGLLTNPLLGLVISIFTALWYLLIDRGLINVILAVLVRPILVTFHIENKSIVGSFWIEIIKAPISTLLGGLLLSQFFPIKTVIVPFTVGLLMWSFNFNLISGLNKKHPYRVIMFILVLIGTCIASVLIL